jgi:hypothetical protein
MLTLQQLCRALSADSIAAEVNVRELPACDECGAEVCKSVKKDLVYR